MGHVAFVYNRSENVIANVLEHFGASFSFTIFNGSVFSPDDLALKCGLASRFPFAPKYPQPLTVTESGGFSGGTVAVMDIA
jgi:hypothetical protein